MDWPTVNYQINDLPNTFKRTGTTYGWLSNSLTAALHRFTNACDGVNQQTTFSNATGKWLDTWGLMFGIPRLAYEPDSVYKNRITSTLMLGGGTPVEIIDFINLVYNTLSSVTENLFNGSSWSTTPSYVINVSSALSAAQYQQLASLLSVVRPTGIPFTFNILAGGLVLGTLNYAGTYRTTGSYLTEPNTQLLPQIPSSTNNSVPLIPTLYLTDPTMNPSLPPAVAPTFIQPTAQTQTWGSDAYTNFTLVTADPNGTLAGSVNDKAFNSANRVLYVCTTAGTTTTAVWSPVNASIST